MNNQILHGDALTKLKELESESVDCIITSPPYWALRDYKTEGTIWDETKDCEHDWNGFIRKGQTGGTKSNKVRIKEQENFQIVQDQKPHFCSKCNAWKGELGQEPTIDLYINHLIQIFNEAKRVLKKTGTCWVVLGDTYAGHKGEMRNPGYKDKKEGYQYVQDAVNRKEYWITEAPEKSLCMIPERFAIAMTSRRGSLIKKESDRAWLAGIIEGEGCIHIHKREKGRKNATYGIFLSIHNTNKKMIDKVVELTGLGGNLQISNIKTNQTLYRWNAMSENAKSVLRDVYPYMVTKREQVRCALYCPSSGKEAEECFLNLKCLHHYEPQTRDYPEPEVGGVNPWILRNKIIWKKNNCMPSSAKDRFTIDYEYIYFFSKSQKYYFKTQYEPYQTTEEPGYRIKLRSNKIYDSKEPYKNNFQYQNKRNTGIKFGGNKADGYGNPTYSGKEWIYNPNGKGRIKRCVWSINPQQFPESHFAVFPEELVKQCMNAGCPDEGIILDPFLGSGTTALVALKNNRRFIGIELNGDYVKIALKRIEPYLYQAKII